MNCQLLRLDNGQPFVATATVVSNPDGSTSFQLPDGNFVGQAPSAGGNTYGVRYADSPENKQYQRATVANNTATFLPRDEDTPYAYLLVVGKVYPS